MKEYNRLLIFLLLYIFISFWMIFTLFNDESFVIAFAIISPFLGAYLGVRCLLTGLFLEYRHNLIRARYFRKGAFVVVGFTILLLSLLAYWDTHLIVFPFAGTLFLLRSSLTPYIWLCEGIFIILSFISYHFKQKKLSLILWFIPIFLIGVCALRTSFRYMG